MGRTLSYVGVDADAGEHADVHAEVASHPAIHDDEDVSAYTHGGNVSI